MHTTTDRSKDLMLGLVSPQQRLGEILRQAGLISAAQISVAAHDQELYTDMRLGEVLALRGWLKQETADFFAEQWTKVICEPAKLRIGDYLKAAALVDQGQIDNVCREQWQTGLRFGSAAVVLGVIEQSTLDFLLTYLYPKEKLEGALMKKRPEISGLEKSSTHQDRGLDTKTTLSQGKTTLIQPESDDVQWIG
ncbi:MAG: hypothetical protein WA902_16575 [Thermosynechococcaceae cyanobacterium]